MLFRQKNPILRIFLILHNERGEEVDQNYINGFSEKKKILVRDKLTILVRKKMCHFNSGFT